MTPLMAFVVVCGMGQGVDNCLTRVDVTNTYHDRAACIARGKYMAAEATRGFGYASVVEPYRVKIRCLTKKQTAEPTMKGKPDYDGKMSAPARPKAPAPKPAPAPETHWWWPFPTPSWWPF